MASDMFIKIGDLGGESSDKDHEGQIDVLSWSWGMSQGGTMHGGGGGGAGKATVGDISLMKNLDKSSPNLIKACQTGQHIAEAILECRKAGGTALPYYKLTMKDVLITSVQTGGSPHDERMTESVSLNFRSYTVVYQEQDEKGAKKGGEVKYGYDIAKGAPASS
jgi:type VI secretion system secreted protein Hcp